MMHDEYLKLIAELDRVLSQIRLLWMESKSPEEEVKWRKHLDKLLAERFRLMGARDAAKAISSNA